jgi:hypothetical protein
MVDEERPGGPESGDEGASETPAQTGQAADPARGTPTVSGDDQHAAQTQAPAPDDDVGVPADPGHDDE